jgi:predicted RNA-binding Zn-ribbon protein involved in translation (DUF1610 family)
MNKIKCTACHGKLMELEETDNFLKVRCTKCERTEKRYNCPECDAEYSVTTKSTGKKIELGEEDTKVECHECGMIDVYKQ